MIAGSFTLKYDTVTYNISSLALADGVEGNISEKETEDGVQVVYDHKSSCSTGRSVQSKLQPE